MRTEKATEAKTTTHMIAGEIRRAHTILNNFCITIGWLRREIDVGSFRHVHRRYVAGGTGRTQTFTTHARAKTLYNMDQHSVFSFRFVEGFSVRVCLWSASSASDSSCDAARGCIHKVKIRGVLHAPQCSPDRLAAVAPSPPMMWTCPSHRSV